MRGRKPIPTKLKLVRSNPGKRALPKDEPQPAPSKLKPPVKLTGAALKQWRVVAKQLHDMGLLTVLDEHALALYCETYARYRQALDAIDQDGLIAETSKGTLTLSPYVKIAEHALDRMVKILTEFGMTPSSRVRVAAPGKSGNDEWAEFFGE